MLPAYAVSVLCVYLLQLQHSIASATAAPSPATATASATAVAQACRRLCRVCADGRLHKP
jgi:hypothetical protein